MTSREPEALIVFVDRDGVICENRPDHIRKWSEFVFIPGSIEALASLARAGARLFVVTNQAVVGRGLLSRRSLDDLHERMLDTLAGAGATIESVLVCPHHPDDGCACRKPKPGMLKAAAARFAIDLSQAVLIGDHATDIEAGARAGCETILVKTGRGKDVVRAQSWGRWEPDFIADDLVDAAIWVLGRSAMRSGRRSMRLDAHGAEVKKQ